MFLLDLTLWYGVARAGQLGHPSLRGFPISERPLTALSIKTGPSES